MILESGSYHSKSYILLLYSFDGSIYSKIDKISRMWDIENAYCDGIQDYLNKYLVKTKE